MQVASPLVVGGASKQNTWPRQKTRPALTRLLMASVGGGTFIRVLQGYLHLISMVGAYYFA